MDNGSDNKQPSKAGHKLSFSSRFVTAPFLVLEEENQIALAGRVTSDTIEKKRIPSIQSKIVIWVFTSFYTKPLILLSKKR